MTVNGAGMWVADWVWAIPLIMGTVVAHVMGLMLIDRVITAAWRRASKRRRILPLFVVIMGVTGMLVTILHGLEGLAWALAYLALGAVPDNRSAILYSISSMTSYGHAEVFLAPHWQLMGALEALNGMLLFGLTTAFLFSTMLKLKLFQPP